MRAYRLMTGRDLSAGADTPDRAALAGVSAVAPDRAALAGASAVAPDRAALAGASAVAPKGRRATVALVIGA